MDRGHVCGRGSRLITTAAGADAVKASGLPPTVVDLAQSAFYHPERLAERLGHPCHAGLGH